MAEVFNFDFYQTPHTGVEDTTAPSNQQTRAMDMKMSNFGALQYGPRSTDDYTRTLTGNFKAKGDLENPVVPSFAMDAEFDMNPFVWGSTVKRVRNDEFTVMGLGSRRDVEASLPGFDVMDTDVANPAGFQAPRHYPSEGWRTFGGRTGGPFNYDPTK